MSLYSLFSDLETASRQTMVASAVHRKCDIAQVTGKTDNSQDGKAMTVIPGIEDDMRAAFDEECALVVTGARVEKGGGEDQKDWVMR